MRVGRGRGGRWRCGGRRVSVRSVVGNVFEHVSSRAQPAHAGSAAVGGWQRHAIFAAPLGMEPWPFAGSAGSSPGWWLLGAGAALALGAGVVAVRRWWRGRHRIGEDADSPLRAISPAWRAALVDCCTDSYGRQSRGRVRLRRLIAPLGSEERRRIANSLVISFLCTERNVITALAWTLGELAGPHQTIEAANMFLPAPDLVLPVAGESVAAYRRICQSLHQVLGRALLWNDEALRGLDGVDVAGGARDVSTIHRATAELRLWVRQWDATTAEAMFAQLGPPPLAAVDRIIQATVAAALVSQLPARARLTAVLPLLDRWVAGEAWVGQEVATLLTLFAGGEALRIVQRLEPGLMGPEGVRIAAGMLRLIPRLRPGKRSVAAMAIISRLAAAPETPMTAVRSGTIPGAANATRLASDDLARLAAEIPNESLPIFLDGVTRLLGPKTLTRLLPIIEGCWPRVQPRQRGPITLALARVAREAGLRLRSGDEPDPMAVRRGDAPTVGERIATLVAQSSAQDIRAVFDALIRLRQRRPSGLLWDRFESQCFLLLAPLKRHERMVVAALFVERYGVGQLPLRIIAGLLRPVGGVTFQEFATARTDPQLLIVARYAAAGLPWERGFWGEYERSGWSEAWMRETGAQVDRYRRGAALADVNDPVEQRRAFAALDLPKGLTFETFVSRLRPELPPPEWLSGWTMQVPEVVSAWAQLDHHALQTDIALMQGWMETATIETLRNVARSWTHVPVLRTIVEEHPAPTDPRGHRAWVLGLIQTLVAAGRLGAPGVSAWLRAALLWLTWNDPTAAGLRAAITPLWGPEHQCGILRRLEGARALEELLRDRLADAARAAGMDLAAVSDGPVAPLHEVLALRQRLVEHLRRGTTKPLRTVSAEAVPSRSQADRCIHFVADDCTASLAIDSPDFQLLRLVADRRLTGAIYAERAWLGDTGLRVLVVAPEPRPEWSIDYGAFLAELERTLPVAAAAEGFAAVVLMASDTLQTNRRDLLDAIRLRRFPQAGWPLRFGRPSIFAVTFGDPTSRAHATPVLVMWQDPAQAAVLNRFRAFRHDVPKVMAWHAPLPAGEMMVPEAVAPPVARVLAPVDGALEEVELVIDLDDLAPDVGDDVRPPPHPVAVQLDERPFDRTAALRLVEWQAGQVPVHVQQAMAAAPPAWWARVSAALAAEGVSPDDAMLGIPGPGGDGDAPQRRPPVLDQRRDQPVVPGTLVLWQRPLLAIHLNARVTRTDRGWIEPTLDGKTHVIEVEEGYDRLPATGTEVTPQDLFDFHQVVFHQARHFRAFLVVLRDLGADIQPLSPQVDTMDETLTTGLRALLERRWADALQALQTVDNHVSAFRATMRGMANTVGIEVDPVTGWIYPLVRDVDAGAAVARQGEILRSAQDDTEADSG